LGVVLGLFIITAPIEKVKGQNTFPTPSGSVGIGTTQPSSLLEIYQAGDSLVTITGKNASGNAVGIDFKRAEGGTVNSAIRAVAEINNDYNNLQFWTRGISGYSERMRIDNSGNVGIGTTSPGNRLTIAGSGDDT